MRAGLLTIAVVVPAIESTSDRRIRDERPPARGIIAGGFSFL